ncbi:serine hydrolase domain-containing protein [Tenacibaculum discolor]|uniref:Serine hydrolase n=1 Tax=Tenacibaculum discolor TaxID=361581 RepID=A0A2G1BTX1_9FLAO|nr:serine hydrolase domain-containing protein [Tenacibaculum discolor]MDP2541820.1 serine hydrolase domain-containing protein [Tenacibaculum discolor]PHN97503.1 serine hydrolase [Tenacibaculum discolor]PHO01244.1 serine hydrolase [Rhodobacteraceae bacterium 4F10]RLK06574.1 CubicO group peptidase (beta-lactamase class C family) [Tenacibaculum discolor]
MKQSKILGLLIFISIGAFGQQDIRKEIALLLKDELQNENIKSGLMHVYSETRGIDIQLAKSKEDSISIQSPFYTASVTKMLTATAIGILKDQKKLNFEDSIAKYLPDSLTYNLHVIDGKEFSKAITITHLLQHTSGLPDYFTDDTIDGSPNIINQLLADTNKIWLPKEMIEFTKEKMKPHFNPGKGYHYTDTEYVLLALIIEKVSGLSYDAFLKKHIFQPLGMDGSYVNLKSKPLKNKLPVAEFYVGDLELSSIQSLSADWGGGGLVSTTQDLIRFLKAFNEDEIVKNETRLEMQHWTNETLGMEYGFGIRKLSFNTLYDTDSNLQLIGHTGSTASFLWYCTQLDTYITGSLNQLEVSKNTLNLVYSILKIIENN